jgi:hypothetical protein
MRPAVIEKVDILFDHAPSITFIEDQNVIQSVMVVQSSLPNKLAGMSVYALRGKCQEDALGCSSERMRSD